MSLWDSSQSNPKNETSRTSRTWRENKLNVQLPCLGQTELFLVSARYPNDLTFASRIVNGVNFVAADDGYYNFTEEQLRLMKKEVAKGLPIVFLCHVPLYAPKHYAHQMQRTGGVCACETGVPDELVKAWKGGVVDPSNWHDRRVQQRTDAATAEFAAYLKSQRLVKAVLCGHCHEFWEVDCGSKRTRSGVVTSAMMTLLIWVIRG